MSKFKSTLCKLCRREGMKLFLKGKRCVTDKCPFERRSFPPGEHHKSFRAKFSDYSQRLREKQKVRRIYGVKEKQFRRFFKLAESSKGITGKVLLQLLERRLDNVVFRSNFALSRQQAKQIINHGHIYVNSFKTDIPSYLVEEGDIIKIKGSDRSKKLVKENIELAKERTRPSWLEVEEKKLEAKVLRMPSKEDVQQPIQEQLIVELYSR